MIGILRPSTPFLLRREPFVGPSGEGWMDAAEGRRVMKMMQEKADALGLAGTPRVAAGGGGGSQ
jgi:hypothetical protein